MRYISIFSGIEAASVAWRPLGWEPVAFSEIEPFPCRVLAERFPNVPNLGDITEVDWTPYAGTVDLVVGGSPCQSFSVAAGANRIGLEGASGLMWEYVRCIREVRPKWLVWENVPGALSSNKGEDFRCLLESMDELGFRLAWRCLDSQFYGLAQRRLRLFLVGCSGGIDPRSPQRVLFEPEGLLGDKASVAEKRASLAADTGGGPESPITFVDRCGRAGGGKGVLAQLDVASTLDTSCSQRVVEPLAFKTGNSAQARSLGEHFGVAPTLPSSAGGNTVPAVAVGTPLNAGDPQSGRVYDPAGVSPTLCSDRGGRVPKVLAFAENQRGELRTSDVVGALAADGPGKQGGRVLCTSGAHYHSSSVVELAPTMTAHSHRDPLLATYMLDDELPEPAEWVTSNGADVFPSLCATDGSKQFIDNQSVRAGRLLTGTWAGRPVVRRLTPLECERLQGFPDGWTAIEGASNTARYKALGNSMAVPVMRWIGRRIQAVEDVEADPWDIDALATLIETPIESEPAWPGKL